MADIAMNAFTPAMDCECLYVELADGSQGRMKKTELMNLISSHYPQIEYLKYGLGGVNHIGGDTEEIAEDTWVYAVGFSDGDVVTVSLESDAGTTINVYRDDGYTMGVRFTVSDTNRITKTVTNLGGKSMLIFSQNGPIRKIMAEKGYFASDWRKG